MNDQRTMHLHIGYANYFCALAGIAFGETGGQFWAIHAMIYSSSALYGLAEIFYYHGWLTLENWDYATLGIMSCNNVLTSTAHYAAGNFGPEHVLIVTVRIHIRIASSAFISFIVPYIGYLDICDHTFTYTYGRKPVCSLKVPCKNTTFYHN